MCVWCKIENWDVEEGEAILYDSEGNEIDRLDIDSLIEGYIRDMKEKFHNNAKTSMEKKDLFDKAKELEEEDEDE